MVKKICNHCGKIYFDECECRKKNKKYSETKSFYKTKAWRSTSNYVRLRDFKTDRLALFLAVTNKIFDIDVFNKMKNFLVLPNGMVRDLKSILIVHHIVPADEDASLLYDTNNLITLSKDTHELVHQIYKTKNKKALQDLLREAVKFKF